MSDPIRRVLVPDLAFEEATVTSNSQQGRRAPMTSDASASGSLVVPGFPSVEDDEHGDGRPRFSGTPTDDESYFVDTTHPGVVGTSRFSLVSPETAWAPGDPSTYRKVKQSPLIAGQRTDILESYYDDPDSVYEYIGVRPKAVYTGEKVIVVASLTQHAPYDRYTKNPTSGALATRANESLNAVWVHRKNAADQNWEFSDVVYLPPYGGIFDPVGIAGLEYFADTDHLVLVVVYGTLVLQGEIVTYVSEDYGESWTVAHTNTITRDNAFDIKRNYEDTIKYAAQNAVADDSDFRGTIQFSDGFDGNYGAFYVRVVKPGVAGLPNTPVDECARVVWKIAGSASWDQGTSRLSRFEKGGRYTHLTEGVSIHFAQTVDRSIQGGVQYGRTYISSAFEPEEVLVLKYVAATNAWVIDAASSGPFDSVSTEDSAAIQLSFDTEHPDNTVGSFANDDRIAISFLDRGWPGFSYSGQGLRFYAEYVDAGSWSPAHIPVDGDPSSALVGTPVYSGQAIELTDAGTSTGVSVTFYHDTSTNDLEFASEYTCTYDARSYFHDIDVVRLSNDRLVALVTTSTGSFSMFSDDRGATWSTTTMLQFGENVYAAGGSISLLHNGTLAASINPTLGWRAVPDPDPTDTRLSAPEEQQWNNYLFFSKDGETWTGPVLLDNQSFGNAIERRVVERPDGWPMLLSQQHYFYNSAVTIAAKNTVAGFDAVHERCFAVKHITGNEDINTLFPSHKDSVIEIQGDAIGAEHWPFLWSSQAQRRGYQEGIYPVGYSGQAHGLAYVKYMGRLEIISPYVVCAEDAGAYPSFEDKGSYAADLETINEAVLRVYNTAYWTSVVEDLSFDQDNQYFDYYDVAWAGRSYQCSWDAGVDPENEDWDPGSGAGSFAQVFAADDNRGGYMKLSCSAGDSNIYSLETLPNSRGQDTDSNTSFRSCVRIIFKPVSGGSATWATKDDLVVAGLVLVDNNGEFDPLSARWEVRCEVSGAGALTVRLFDAVAGTQIGDDYTATAGFEWLELLVATTQEGVDGSFDPVVVCYAAIRELDHSEYETDFSWIESSGEVMTLGGNTTEKIYWGCEEPAGGTTASALWKSVHLHRGQQQSYILPAYAGGSGTYPAVLRPHTPFTPSLDTGFTSRFALPGAVISDSGLNNPPLPPRSCYLSQYLRKGLSVSWEGNSKARLSWPVAPEYQYPSEASNQQPVQRRYRSELQETYVGNAPDQEYLVFDSGHSGGIKADGIAIFGNNFPQLLVELDTSSSFSSPYVFRIGVPVGDADLDYDCSLWSDTLATEGGNILGKSTDGRNLRFLSSTSQGWRPHQFASSESGQQFYVVASTSSSPSYCNVCRILDNTEDTLMLEEEADTSVLVDLDPLPSGFKVAIYSDRFAADFGAVRTYRYARISADITGPSASFVEYPVIFYPSTKRYWELGRVMLGRWFDINNPYVEWGWSYSHDSGYKLTDTPSKARFSKRESTLTRKVTASYDFLHWDVRSANTRAVDAERSWQHMIDLLRRLEIDGRPCALVWEATDNDGSFTNGDPFEVLCVRADIGDSTHTMYNNRVGSNNVCTPKPVMSLSGLTFTEED